MREIIGNKTVFETLFFWIKNYSSQKERIALLAGPPGIGKTSGTIAIAKELNYEIIELNASDQRNQAIITSLVGRASRTRPNPGYNGKIILLDEVDGLSGRDDRGGVSALMKLSKKSRFPIVSTANDPYNIKLRTLRLSSKFLQLKSPSQKEIAFVLNNIVKYEQIIVDPTVINILSKNKDIRAAINDLANLAQGREEIGKQSIIVLKERDYETTIFTALRKIFGESKSAIQAISDTRDLDVDYQDFINFVHENALHFALNTKELADMYDHISKADVFRGRIMREQQWSLLKYFYFHLSAGVRNAKKTPIGFGKQMARYSAFFENWAQRQKRKDIAFKIGKTTHTSINKTMNGTLPYLEIIYSNLKKPRGKKNLTRKENPTLDQVTRITYANDFNSSDLEYFYKKNSALIPWIQESIEEYEGELVKEFIINDRGKMSKLERTFDEKSKIDKSKPKNDEMEFKNELVSSEEGKEKNIKKLEKRGKKIPKNTKKKANKEEKILNYKKEEEIAKSEDLELLKKEEKKKTKNLMDFL